MCTQEAFSPKTKECRLIRRFSDDVEQRTRRCLSELLRKTTSDRLLAAAGGNKWIARRAIELYKRGLWPVANTFSVEGRPDLKCIEWQRA